MSCLRTVFVIATVTLAVSCAFRPAVDDGPTNEEIMHTTGLTVEEATRVAAENLSVALGAPVDPDRENVAKIGCRTDPDSLMSVGPPWRVRLSFAFAAPQPEHIAQIMARVETLVGRGFTLQQSNPNDRSSDDRAYRNADGFTVSTSTSTLVLGGPGLTITSVSPCAAE